MNDVIEPFDIPRLEPCPFCGSVDLTLDKLIDDEDWFVHCNQCEIQQIANYSQPEAIRRWNARRETTYPQAYMLEQTIHLLRTELAALSSRGDAGTLDMLLRKLDEIARRDNAYEYGLPLHDENLMALMRQAIAESALAHRQETQEVAAPRRTPPDTTRECKLLFLAILRRKYAWLNWSLTDTQLALIIDAMEAGAESALAHRGYTAQPPRLTNTYADSVKTATGVADREAPTDVARSIAEHTLAFLRGIDWSSSSEDWKRERIAEIVAGRLEAVADREVKQEPSRVEEDLIDKVNDACQRNESTWRNQVRTILRTFAAISKQSRESAWQKEREAMIGAFRTWCEARGWAFGQSKYIIGLPNDPSMEPSDSAAPQPIPGQARQHNHTKGALCGKSCPAHGCENSDARWLTKNPTTGPAEAQPIPDQEVGCEKGRSPEASARRKAKRAGAIPDQERKDV